MEPLEPLPGIEPGGLTTDYEVRLLLCYLLDKVGEPMTFEQINDALQEKGLVHYFQFAQAVSQLVRSGHLLAEPDARGVELLRISDLGRRTSATFERSLPLAVREKALNTARGKLLAERLARENAVEITPVQDGFILTLTISDVGSDLLRLSLFVPTEERCRQMKAHFLTDPAALYRAVVELLCTDNPLGRREAAEQIESQ